MGAFINAWMRSKNIGNHDSGFLRRDCIAIIAAICVQCGAVQPASPPFENGSRFEARLIISLFLGRAPPQLQLRLTLPRETSAATDVTRHADPVEICAQAL